MSNGHGKAQISDKVAEQTRTFLLGLFMGLRTAQIHDTSNKAFQNALLTVHESADTLYKSTGGFRIQFVDEAIFMNGARVRLERSAYNSMRALKGFLEAQEIGGIGMSGPPTFESIERLVLGLAQTHDVRETAINASDLELLGIQKMAEDAEEEVKVDRRVLAIQSYGKLLLAMRDLLDHAESGGTDLPKTRIRVVRVVQDIVELVADRPDFILRLSTNRHGTNPAELHGVNVTLLAIAIGGAIGLDRRQLVDLGIAGMFHHVACRRHRYAGKIRLGREVTLASIGHLMFQSGAGPNSHARTTIVACHRERAYDLRGAKQPSTNISARILGLATAYDQLTSGFGTRHEVVAHPLAVLGVLMQDASGRFDPDLVDVLVNVLRAFPEGCEVVLDDGNHATVQSHIGSSRWDRPIVKVIGTRQPRDLMTKTGDRFDRRIIGTPRYCGRFSRLQDEEAPTDPAIPVGAAGAPFEEDSPGPKRESVDMMLRDYLSESEDGSI